MNSPLISILIPHYGGEKILQDCLDSLKSTNYSNLEILVLDNNSSDDLDLTITPNTLNALDVDIPSDTSSAAFWMVAACCHPDAEITIKNLGMNPTRIGVIEVLLNMGGKINQTTERSEGGEPVADLTVSSSKLESVEISGDLIPKLVDELPILSLAACFAEGKTIIKDAEE